MRRHLLILFADWAPGRSLPLGLLQAKELEWGPRDLQHKLKARAMHINSNLDRRIKPNDFNYTDSAVNLSCHRNELKLCQQRDYEGCFSVCVGV